MGERFFALDNRGASVSTSTSQTGFLLCKYRGLSFDVFSPSFSSAESPLRDLQITAYK